MPLKQIRRDDALTKIQFHTVLRDWLNRTDEERIGPASVDGRTSWIHVLDGARTFGLHADTGRDAVERYLQCTMLHGDDLQWEIAQSQRGNMTAVVYGPEQLRYRSFYLYLLGGGPQI